MVSRLQYKDVNEVDHFFRSIFVDRLHLKEYLYCRNRPMYENRMPKLDRLVLPPSESFEAWTRFNVGVVEFRDFVL